MATNIENFWLKITAVFLTMYFAPAGHFIFSIFGIRANDGKAYAGTIYCETRNNMSANMECGGKSGTYHPGDTVRCICATDSTKYTDVQCEMEGGYDSYGQEVDYGIWKELNYCYSPNACSPNGSTKDCSSTARYCTQTCTNGVWGPEVWGNCKSGYIKISGICMKECTIANGKGYEIDESSSSSSSEI